MVYLEQQKSSQTDEEQGTIQKEGEIDLSKTPFQRILTYLQQVDDPCSFDMEGYHVEMEWKDTDITLQNRVEEIFASV